MNNDVWQRLFLSGGNRPVGRKPSLVRRMTQPLRTLRARAYVRGMQRRGKRRGRGR